MNQRNHTMRLIASAVVFTFTFTSLGMTPNTFAATGVPTPEVSLLTAGTLAIPAELGQVTDTVTGDSSAPTLIHIQSAHGNYQAEKNIEKLLSYIEKNSSVKLMLLEGASNKLHPELFRIFPKQPDFNRKVTDKLMQEGYLTGPESFLIESSDKTEGWGVENLDAYKKDREAFISVVKSDNIAQAYLLKLRATIDKRFASKLNKDLLNLVRQEEAFGSGTVSFESWIKTLGEGSRKHLKQDLSDAYYQGQYPFLIRYFRLQAIVSKIDREKARREADAFLNELASRKVPKEIIGNFKAILQLPETDLLKTVSRTTDGYSTLRRAFDLSFNNLPQDFSMTQWPNWTLYAQYLILMQEMEGKGLHEETLKLKGKIQTALAKTSDEKEYLTKARELYLLRRLFDLELTRSEYEELVQIVNPSDIQGIQTLYKTAMDFYSTAVDRENKMFANALKRMSQQKQDRAVIVIGGFHADGLKKLATSKNCSYIQITPRIAEVSKRDHEVYLHSILGSRDVETSQMSALLGIVDRVQRVTVTGVAATQAWFQDVRGIVQPMINSEDLSNRPALVADLSRSFFAPASARAEARNVAASELLQGTSPIPPSGSEIEVTKFRSETREEKITDISAFIFGLAGVIYGIFYQAVPYLHGHGITNKFCVGILSVGWAFAITSGIGAIVGAFIGYGGFSIARFIIDIYFRVKDPRKYYERIKIREEERERLAAERLARASETSSSDDDNPDAGGYRQDSSIFGRSEVRFMDGQEKRFQKAVSDLQPKWRDAIFVETGSRRRAGAFNAIAGFLGVSNTDLPFFRMFIQELGEGKVSSVRWELVDLGKLMEEVRNASKNGVFSVEFIPYEYNKTGGESFLNFDDSTSQFPKWDSTPEEISIREQEIRIISGDRKDSFPFDTIYWKRALIMLPFWGVAGYAFAAWMGLPEHGLFTNFMHFKLATAFNTALLGPTLYILFGVFTPGFWKYTHSIEYNFYDLPSAKTSNRARKRLVRAGWPAVPALVKALNGDNANARKEAARALGVIGDSSAIPALNAALSNNKDGEAQFAVAAALLQLDDTKIVDWLIEVLKDPSAYCRRMAATILGRGKVARAVPALMVTLKDPDESVQEAGATALGEIRDPRAKAVLKEYRVRVKAKHEAAEGLAQESESNSSNDDGYDGDTRQDSDIFRPYHSIVPVGLFGGMGKFFIPGSTKASAILLGVGIFLAVKQIRAVLALRDRTGNYQRHVETWASHLRQFNNVKNPTADDVLSFLVSNGPAGAAVFIGLSFVDWGRLSAGAIGPATFFIIWVGAAFVFNVILRALNFELVKRRKITNDESDDSDNRTSSRSEVRLTPVQEKQFQKAMGIHRILFIPPHGIVSGEVSQSVQRSVDVLKGKILPQVSMVDTSSLRAKMGTAIRIAANTVSPLLSSSPVYASEIAPELFDGTFHYQLVPTAVPAAFASQWPDFNAILGHSASASTERVVIDQRQGVPDAASVLPLVTFASYNARSKVRLALIAGVPEVNAFVKKLTALSPKGVLPQNFRVQAFASGNEFVVAFARFYNSAAPLGQSVALITDCEDSVVTRKIGSRRHLLSVVGAQDPLKQTASTLLAADKLLNESIWSMGYHFVSVDKLGGLEALMAELTSYVAAQVKVQASA